MTRSTMLPAAHTLVAAALLFGLRPARTADEAPAPAFPRFGVQEIEKGLGVGYAVRLVDVNNDGKKDIVVVDQRRVVWYENPTWKRRTIIEGRTKPDNVCIAPYDIDGDGQHDFALGAGWNPANKNTGNTLQRLRRANSLEEAETVRTLGEEPTVQHIRLVGLER